LFWFFVCALLLVVDAVVAGIYMEKHKAAGVGCELAKRTAGLKG
jgi:hypothetical protein